MASGFPGLFAGRLTTGYASIGAVGKLQQTAKACGQFPGGLTQGYSNIGAVSKLSTASVFILLEDGSYLLLETGSKLYHELSTVVATQSLFRVAALNGLGSGGPFFHNPVD